MRLSGLSVTGTQLHPCYSTRRRAPHSGTIDTSRVGCCRKSPLTAGTSSDRPPHLMQLQADWHGTYEALAAPTRPGPPRCAAGCSGCPSGCCGIPTGAGRGAGRPHGPSCATRPAPGRSSSEPAPGPPDRGGRGDPALRPAVDRRQRRGTVGAAARPRRWLSGPSRPDGDGVADQARAAAACSLPWSGSWSGPPNRTAGWRRSSAPFSEAVLRLHPRSPGRRVGRAGRVLGF